MFGKAANTISRRPEATEQFKRDLDKAIAAARFGGADVRTIASLCDERADGLRMQFAITAPAGHSLV